MGFKILWRSSMRSTRSLRTEASGQGKNRKNGVGLWPTWRKLSKPSASFILHILCNVIYLERIAQNTALHFTQ